MYSSSEYNPDGRRDIRATRKPKGMSTREYLDHVREHTKAWLARSMFVEILDMVKTDNYFYMEDDYPPPPGIVVHLLRLLDKSPDAAMTSAVQTYRCPFIQEMGIAPAEKIVWDHEKIIEKRCCSPALQGVQDVEGTSFSCFAARADLMREAIATIRRKKLLMTYIGHDMVVTNALTWTGWRILVDFRFWGDHLQLMCAKHQCGPHAFNKSNAIQDTFTWNDKLGRYDIKIGG